MTAIPFDLACLAAAGHLFAFLPDFGGTTEIQKEIIARGLGL